MKHILYSVLIIALLVGWAAPALAATLQAGDEYALAQGETLADDLYMASGTGVISGTIEGDVYAAGGTLFVGGQVTQDVTIVGGSLTVDGTVGGDLVVLGGSVHLAPGASVAGDVVTGAGNVRIDGAVAGTLRGVSGSITINSAVNQVDIGTGMLTLGENAAVAGDLVYRSPQEATIAEGATVTGETVFTQGEAPTREDAKGITQAFGLGFAVFKIIALLILGLLLLWIFPRPTRETTHSALGSFWPQLLRGLIALIVTPIAAIILMVTLVGIPVGIILLTGYVLTLIVAGLFVSFAIGAQVERWVRKNNEHPITWLTLVIGLVVGFVLNFIPIIGWLVVLVFFLVTLGALTQAWQKRIWQVRK